MLMKAMCRLMLLHMNKSAVIQILHRKSEHRYSPVWGTTHIMIVGIQKRKQWVFSYIVLYNIDTYFVYSWANAVGHMKHDLNK